MGKTIVLAHGLFGFGNLLEPIPSLVNYFNGVADHLRRQGHTVFEPQVNPIGSIDRRSQQLATAILNERSDGDRWHIIAHSMGGLDARAALANTSGLARRVATLVTIGTPHRGSPVADAIMNPSDPLAGHIPPFLMKHAGALRNLTTDACIPFDEKTHDVEGVRYIEVAGDASKGGSELILFQLAADIGRIKNQVNDGVVTKASALRSGREHPFDDWPVDHGGEIGWSRDSLIPVALRLPILPEPAHLSRYDAIVALL